MTQTFESGYSSSLSQKFSSTDTVMYVATPPTVTSGRIYLTDGSQRERVSFSGVSGSTLTGCVRNLSKSADPSTAGTGLNWLAGNPIVLVAMHDQIRDKTQPTEVLIYGKTYATTAARDAALGADGAAVHPYTNVYVTATGLHYNYNLSTALREDVSTGTTTPNASTSAAGKVQEATTAEIMARTKTGTTGADLVITPDNMNTINMTAGENLTAGDLVSAYFGTQVRKTIRRFTTATQVGTTTGLDSSTTQRMIKTIHTANGYSVVVYKKSADNKLYATVSKFNAIDLVPIVGTEKLISNDVLEADDGFDVTVLGSNLFRFVVVYKKASDDKAYGVACTYDSTTLTVTAGTATKLYDTNIVKTGTRPTCCSVGNELFAIGLHDSVTDNPVVVPCVTAVNAITAGTPLDVEEVTMNAAGQVMVVDTATAVIGVFYDNGTNIRYCTVKNDVSVVNTPVSLITGYITGSMKVLPIKNYNYEEAAEVMLFMPYAGYVRVLRVNSVTLGTQTNSYFSTTSDNIIPTETDVLTNFDVCALGQTNTGNLSSTPILGFINVQDGSNVLRVRMFNIGTNGFSWIFDRTTSTNSTALTGVCMMQLFYRSGPPAPYIAYIDDTTLYHKLWYNNEDLFVGTVKTTTTAAGIVPIYTSGPVYNNNSLTVGDPVYVGDNGTASPVGTKQIGVAIGTDLILLK